jgi:5'-3' exoribonuclease 1
MFRWLTDQYPDIVNRQLEELVDVDYFYLDMNGIIHPCTHGNNQEEIVVLDETAMFKRIFLYVDRLYKLVQPSKVLYLAVDGTAPRAKMNQQRARRFRAAKDAEMLQSELVARSNMMSSSSSQKKQLLSSTSGKRFDSNCITPGTDFMLKLSLALQRWVQYKMETDIFWKGGATVILSGPDVPGEGEHKVMDFVRLHQSLAGTSPYYTPGGIHVLYGLDADLIMLGLVTHEPNFMLLREKMSVVMAGRNNKGGYSKKKKDMLQYDKNDFEILELSSFRQMLAIQFRKFADVLENYNLERIIDDFVFTCMMVGNDFLPHVPHLEIDSGALSMMMSNYIDLLPEWGGYLTHREKIHPVRLEQFLYQLSIYEEEHFQRRGFEENEPGWKLPTVERETDPEDFYGTYHTGQPTPACAVPAHRKDSVPPPMVAVPMVATGNRAFRRQHPNSHSRSYRDFYYETKLGWKPEERCHTLYQRRAHVREYLEGLHWNLNYYHNGCRSWDWYFPYLYAPLCTDMVNLSEFYTEIDADGFATFEFGASTPFPNLAQLLSVLPPQSSDLLPPPLAELMVHPSSPLVPFYPQDFTSDPNGKRMAWEAVVQIPFIEADVLLDTVQKILNADEVNTDRPLFTPAERKRNERGMEHVYPPPGLTTPEEEVAYQRLKAASAVSSGTLPSRRSSGPTPPPFERRAPRYAKPAGAVRRSPAPRRKMEG